MAKRNVGAVCLVVSFARQPLRAEGLGGDAGADAVFRRPSGLRGRSQLRLAVGRVLCPSVLAGHSRVRPPPCSCESQVPFGRARRRFFVSEVGFGNAFFSVRGGWTNGMTVRWSGANTHDLFENPAKSKNNFNN